MDYVELHARSAFSFLGAASSPETLAEVCAARDIPAIGLLDQMVSTVHRACTWRRKR
jgi:error-prone DNA polymerase